MGLRAQTVFSLLIEQSPKEGNMSAKVLSLEPEENACTLKSNMQKAFCVSRMSFYQQHIKLLEFNPPKNTFKQQTV